MERFTARQTTSLWSLLEDRLPSWKRSTLKERLRGGCVTRNGEVVRRHDAPVEAGDLVEVHDQSPCAAPPRLGLGLRWVHGDEWLVVIDKPAGLLSVSTEGESEKTALHQVGLALSRGRPRSERVWPVHRIDRGTSGLLMIARSRDVREAMQADWHRVEKVYYAVVEGVPSPTAGTIRAPLREARDYSVHIDWQAPEARPAITHYRTVRSTGERSLVEVHLETGRKHQIRVHLASLGTPLVGDERYGAKPHAIGRPALHALRLRFPHPVTGTWHAYESPFPRALAALVAEGRAGAR